MSVGYIIAIKLKLVYRNVESVIVSVMSMMSIIPATATMRGSNLFRIELIFIFPTTILFNVFLPQKF